MSIRQSGLWCDVCNNPKPLEPTTEFSMTGVSPNMMHTCDHCKPLIVDFTETRNTEILPEGPLRNFIEMAMAANEAVKDTATYSNSTSGPNIDKPLDCPICGKKGLVTLYNGQAAYKHTKLYTETTYCLANSKLHRQGRS